MVSLSSSSDEEILVVDEPEQSEGTSSEPVPSEVPSKPPLPPFNPLEFVAKLNKYLVSDVKSDHAELTAMVDEVWTRPFSENYYSEPVGLDSGVAVKLPIGMSFAGGKRIAGTQRLNYAPPVMMKKTQLTEATPSLMRKHKRLVPVIDDSIYCTTDQPCKTCGGVSLSGNQVLICKRCRDCFHMKCSVPPVSIEEASNPKYAYYCKTCLISKKVLANNSKSRSPSPSVFDPKLKKPFIKR